MEENMRPRSKIEVHNGKRMADRRMMMPLTMLDRGEQSTVKTVDGRDQTRLFLQGLGFTEGAPVAVLAAAAGKLVVAIQGMRVELSSRIASHVQVAWQDAEHP